MDKRTFAPTIRNIVVSLPSPLEEDDEMVKRYATIVPEREAIRDVIRAVTEWECEQS